MGSEVEIASTNAVDSDSGSVSWEDFFGERELQYLIFFPSVYSRNVVLRSRAFARARFGYVCMMLRFLFLLFRETSCISYLARRQIKVRARILETQTNPN